MHPPGELLSFTSLTSTATVEPARSTADAIRILIGESQAIFIAGLKSVLASQLDIDNVGVANSFQMLLRLVAETEPDIVLLDESLLDPSALRKSDPLVLARSAPGQEQHS
jgi:DNA-binding NarL/FixJ family response regulator